MDNLAFHTSMVDSFSGYSKPLAEARYVIVGVPYDHTSTFRSGSRFAPRAIREASLNIETYSLRTGVDIENVPIHDAGDLHIVDDLSETLNRLSKVTKDILDEGKMPVCIGGEHSITQAPVRSLPKSVGVVSFDCARRPPRRIRRRQTLSRNRTQTNHRRRWNGWCHGLRSPRLMQGRSRID